MTHSQFSYFRIGNEHIKYVDVIFEEEFEDEPEGFEKDTAGTEIDTVVDEDQVRPWDPTEDFFSYV